MEGSPAESITGVLQATVFRVCQQIIPYSKELVVSGVITIEADGNEFCKFDIKQSSDKERPPSRLQLISQALDKGRPPSVQEGAQERPASRQGRPPSRQGRPPSRQCTRPASRQQKDNASTDSVSKDDLKPRSSSRLALKAKSSPPEKTGLPKPNILPAKNLSGSQSSLVNTLVAEAMKLWYDEGPSPDRLNEIRESDPQRSAAAELSLEAVRQWGQISPETLEAAAQLRRLGEQAAALATMNQNQQTLLTPVIQVPVKPPPPITAEPPPKLNFNEPVKNTRPRRRRGKAKENEAVENLETSVLPQKQPQARRHRFQSEGKDIPVKNSKGMYECPDCGKEFTFSTNLTRHQRNFHGRPFTRKTKDMKHDDDSDILKVTSQSESSRDSTSSSKRSSRSKGCFVCAICFEKFDTDKHLDEHQNTAHSDNSMDEDTLNAGAKDDQSESPTGSVEGSRRRSPRSSVIASREKRKVEGDKLSTTPDMDSKKMRRGRKSEQDVIVIDADNSPTPSDTSSRKSTPPKMYVKMEDEDDLNSIKYSCTFCGRNFPLYRNLGRHLKSTHGVSIVETEMQGLVEGGEVDGEHRGPYTCSICGHGFSFSSNLSRHMSKVHHFISQREAGGKAKSKAARGEASKENEPSNYHGSRNEDRFGCDLCGARFTFSSNLSRHMKRTHKMVRKVVDTSPIVIQDEGESNNGNSRTNVRPAAAPDSSTEHPFQPPHQAEPIGDRGTDAKKDKNTGVETLKADALPATPVSIVMNPVPSTMVLNMTTAPQGLTPLSVPQGMRTIAPCTAPPGLLPKSSLPTLISQPQSLFRPISFGPGPAPVISAGYFSSQIPKSDKSPSAESVSDKEVADMMCPQQSASRKQHQCGLCGEGFSFQSNLQRHLKTVHGNGSGDTEQGTPLQLKLALAPPVCQAQLPPLPTVTSVPLIVPVPLQPISFSPKPVMMISSPLRAPVPAEPLTSPLAAPLGSPDGKASRHICNICNASFTFRTNLTRHMKKQHGQVPPSEIDAGSHQGAGEARESPETPPLVIDQALPAGAGGKQGDTVEMQPEPLE